MAWCGSSTYPWASPATAKPTLINGTLLTLEPSTHCGNCRRLSWCWATRFLIPWCLKSGKIRKRGFALRGSPILQVSAYFGTIALLLALGPGPAKEPKRLVGPSPSSGIRVSPTQQGDSVRFYLSDSWVARFWKGEPSVKPYVAQLPPHKLDTEEQF